MLDAVPPTGGFIEQDFKTLACELIERSLNSEPTLDDILAPFR